MFSSTTIALSTSMPTPNANPPNETVFNVKPLKYIKEKVEITEIGIATPMIIVLEKLRRKNSRTTTANTAPTPAAALTLLIAELMKSAVSIVFSILICG